MSNTAQKLDLQEILESYNEGLKLVSKKQKIASEESSRKTKNEMRTLSLVEKKLKRNRLRAKKENSKQKKKIQLTRSILDELMNKCQEYERKQLELEQKIASYNDSLFLSQNSYQEMNRLARKAKSDFESYSVELETSKKNKTRVELETKSRLKKTQKTYSDLREKIKIQQDRFNFLKKRISDIELSNKDLSAKNYKLQTLYRQIEKNINDNQVFEKQYSREIKHLSLDIEQKRFRFENLTELVTKLQSDYKDLCRLHIKKQDQFSKSSKKKLAIFHESSRRVGELRSKEVQLISRVNSFQVKSNRLDLDIVEKQRELDQINNQVLQKEAKVAETLTLIKKYKQNKDKLFVESSRLEQRFKREERQQRKSSTKFKTKLQRFRLESTALESKITKNAIENKRSENLKCTYAVELDRLQNDVSARSAELDSLDLIYQQRVVRNRDLETEYREKISGFAIFENNSYENLKKHIANQESETKAKAAKIIETSRKEAGLIIVNARSEASSYRQNSTQETDRMKSQILAETKNKSSKKLADMNCEFDDWKMKFQEQVQEIVFNHQGISEDSRLLLSSQINELNSTDIEEVKKTYFFSNSRRVHQFWMSCSIAFILLIAVMGTKVFMPSLYSSAKRGIASVILDQNGEVFNEAIRIAQAKRKKKYFYFVKSNSLQKTQWENTVRNEIYVNTWINNKNFDDSFIKELADFFSYVLKIDDMNSVEVLKLEKSYIRKIQLMTKSVLIEDKNQIIFDLKKLEKEHLIELTNLLGDDFALSNYLKFKRRFYLDFNS